MNQLKKAGVLSTSCGKPQESDPVLILILKAKHDCSDLVGGKNILHSRSRNCSFGQEL